MHIKTRMISILVLSLVIVNCTGVYLVPDSTLNIEVPHRGLSVEQINNLEEIISKPYADMLIQSIEPSKRQTNDINWLTVINKMNDTLRVEITPSSLFRIYTKDGNNIGLLVCTTFVENGVLKGDKSLILGLTKHIPLAEIDSIKVLTRGSKTYVF